MDEGKLPEASKVPDELVDVTRRAFISKMYVELWKESPLLKKLVENTRREAEERAKWPWWRRWLWEVRYWILDHADRLRWRWVLWRDKE